MKAIVTVIGKDRVGITAAVCALLAQHNINILDISQTVLQQAITRSAPSSRSSAIPSRI